MSNFQAGSSAKSACRPGLDYVAPRICDSSGMAQAFMLSPGTFCPSEFLHAACSFHNCLADASCLQAQPSEAEEDQQAETRTHAVFSFETQATRPKCAEGPLRALSFSLVSKSKQRCIFADLGRCRP